MSSKSDQTQERNMTRNSCSNYFNELKRRIFSKRTNPHKLKRTSCTKLKSDSLHQVQHTNGQARIIIPFSQITTDHGQVGVTSRLTSCIPNIGAPLSKLCRTQPDSFQKWQASPPIAEINRNKTKKISLHEGAL